MTRLKKEDGQFTEDEIELRAMTSNFYKNLYAMEWTKDMDGVLSTVPTKLTQEMNRKLLDPSRSRRIYSICFRRRPKVPMGSISLFSETLGATRGKEVTAIVLKLLHGEEEPKGINKTLIVLFLKVASPRRSVNFSL